MNTVLIIVTLVEVLLLVVVLAGYLMAIAARLRRVSKTLGLVTFGVRAIESQTATIAPALSDVNAALGQVAGALQDVVGEAPPPTEAVAGTTSTMTPRGDAPRPTTP